MVSEGGKNHLGSAVMCRIRSRCFRGDVGIYPMNRYNEIRQEEIPENDMYLDSATGEMDTDDKVGRL